MASKQVICCNMKAPMSLGRLSAQCAHASILAILHLGKWNDTNFIIENCRPDIKEWLKEHFTKVVVKVWGEEELLALEKRAKELDIPTGLMMDDGIYTALAIGPAENSLVNLITKDLPLL